MPRCLWHLAAEHDIAKVSDSFRGAFFYATVADVQGVGAYLQLCLAQCRWGRLRMETSCAAVGSMCAIESMAGEDVDTRLRDTRA